MDGVGLTLLGATLIGGLWALAWRWQRARRLRITHRSVHCPLHDCHASVAVHTDPAARSSRQYVDVAVCSLLSGAAIALPERISYLADFPPEKVRLEPARSVYTATVSCRQPCVFVLNESAGSTPLQPLACASGISDAAELSRQVVGNARLWRLGWYHSN
jgi:hypothetical protein